MKNNLLLLLFLVPIIATADGTWDGGGTPVAPNWSTAANWVGDALPNTNGSGTISFRNQAIPGSNVVDMDWRMTALRYTNSAFGQAHTTHIASGKSLIVTNGSVAVGENSSNCWVEIRGGTLQLGAVGGPASLAVGAHSVVAVNTSNRLAILSAINGGNWSNLWVGRQTALQNTPSDGSLDLSGASITTFGEANKLNLSGSLVVGGGGGRNPNGVLKLPPALTEIDVLAFEIAYGGGSQVGNGTLDLGAASQLAKFTARTGCYFGRNGIATVIGWPSNVTMVVGQPGAPSPMVVGSSQGNIPGITGQLALTNGSFTAWLSSLKVGSQPYTGAAGFSTGLLDLASTTVAIGGATNMILLDALSVGGDHGRGPNGSLLLPADITNITVGLFEIGAGSYTYSTLATLDFGVGSKLRTLTVTNDFALGNPGSASLLHFPTNVSIRIGQPEQAVSMVVGLSEGAPIVTRFSPTNATLNAWLSALRVGCNTYSGGGTPFSEVELDLSTCQVQIGGAANMMKTPELRVGGQGGRYMKSLLKLPPAITNITVGMLEIGNAYPNTASSGILDLGVGAQLKTLIASNGLTLGQGSTAAIQGFPADVDVTVGAPGNPAPLMLGNTTIPGGNTYGALILSGGTFTGWISQLKIGCNSYVTGGSGITGVLDLASATVQIGDRPNSVEIPEIRLGGDKGRNGNGILRLPASVTNFSAGTLEIAAGSGTSFGNGTLDFSAGSTLKSFAVTNSLTLGYIGTAVITNLPANMRFQLGSAEAPIPVVIGLASNGTAVNLIQGLRLPESSRFSAVLSSLDIGINEHTYQGGSTYGFLDMTNKVSLDGFAVTGDVRLGYSLIASNIYGRGVLQLPAGDASVGGSLFLGDSTNTSRGILFLDGTRLAVSGKVTLAASAGFVTNYVRGVSAGLDLLSADTNNLSLGAGSRIMAVFSEPVNRLQPVWGLRMKGNATAYFQSLTTSPAKVFYDVSGLSASTKKDFGVYYDSRLDVTFLGVPKNNKGALMLLR